MNKPETRVGVTKPDMTKGNKVSPTTKAKPAPNAEPGRHTPAEKKARDGK